VALHSALAPEFDEKNNPALVEQPSIRKIKKAAGNFEGQRGDGYTRAHGATPN
jgi:hypothetical protein